MNPYNSAQQVGYTLGGIIALLLFALPVVLCGMTLRRKRANKKCLLSLMLVLAPLPMSGTLRFLPVGVRTNPAFFMGVGLAFLGLWVASMVLAILGLAEFKRRRSRFGRKRAIVALVLNVGLLITCIGVGIKNSHRRAVANAEIFDEKAPPFISEQFNFRLVRPPPWVGFDAHRFNPSAVVGAFRAKPQMYFTVVAEKPGVESPLTTPALVDLAKAHMQSASKVRIVREIPMQLHGIAGTRIETDAELQGGSFSYLLWATVYHGYAYQLLAWTPVENRESLYAEAADLFQHFELLHPEQVAHAPGITEAKDYHSLTGGFSVRLAGTLWNRPMAKLFERFPSADFGISSSGDDALIVIPLPLAKGVDPEIGILTQACLSRFGVDFPGDNVHGLKKITHGPLTGNALSFDPPATPSLRYHAEILKGNGLAYLLLALSTKTSPNDEKIAEVLSRVEFEEKPAIPSPKDFTSRENESRALYFNEMGLAYYKKENFPLAKQYFRIAQELAPENPTFLQNLVDALLQTGNNREALDFLQANMHGRANTDKLCVRLAWLQQQTGDVQGALRTYASVFSGNFFDDSALDAYLGLLCQQKRYDDALAEIQKYTSEHDSIVIRLTQAAVYVLKKQFEDALKMLRELQQKYPENNQITATIAKTLYSAERYAQAADLCEKMIGNGNGTSLVYGIKGRSELGLKRFRESKVSFEEALKQDPTNADIKSLLTWVSGMLGQGDNTALKNRIEPVEMPADLPVPASVDGTCAYLAGCGGYFTNYSKAIFFKKGDEYRVTEYRTVKILNESGVKDFSSFEIPFDPVSEGIFVNELTVKDPDGKTLSTGKVDDYYLIDDTSSGQATQHKLLHIPVSGLRPGCIISLRVTRRDFGTPKEFRYSQHLFSKQFPILQSVLYIEADPAAYKAITSAAPVSHTAKGNASLWSIDHPPVIRYEPLQPNADAFVPGVCLGDPTPSWTQASKDYLNSISDRLEPDDATSRIAKEKTASLNKSEDKIAALIESVQKDLTYTAIEFGRRARIPNPSEVTARNRYGDCKDHALLLRQLLEASGIHAHLVLVNANGEFHKEIPTIDQFNHMIVYIPSFRGGTYVDCTDKDSDLTSSIPAGLAKKDVLILDGANPRLAKIPDYPPDSSVITVTRRVEILSQSNLSVSEDVTMKGAPASLFRSFYRRCEASSRKIALQQQLAAGAPTLEIHDLSAEHVDDHRSSLALHMTYSAKGKFHSAGGQLVGQLPAVWERFFLASQPVDKRQTPFQITYPVNFSSNTTISIPSGYTTAPLKQTKVNGKFMQCELSSAGRKDALQIAWKIHQPAGSFASAQYVDYHEALSRVFEMLEQNLVLMKAGG